MREGEDERVGGGGGEMRGMKGCGCGWGWHLVYDVDPVLRAGTKVALKSLGERKGGEGEREGGEG